MFGSDKGMLQRAQGRDPVPPPDNQDHNEIPTEKGLTPLPYNDRRIKKTARPSCDELISERDTPNRFAIYLI